MQPGLQQAAARLGVNRGLKEVDVQGVLAELEVPRVRLSQEWACPKKGPVPRVGLSQEWACPKSGPVPRAGLSQAFRSAILSQAFRSERQEEV